MRGLIIIGVLVELALLIFGVSYLFWLLLFVLIGLAVKETGSIIKTGISWNRVFRLGIIFAVLLIGFFFSYQSVLFFFTQGKLTLELQEPVQKTPEEIVQAPKQEPPVLLGQKVLPEQLFDINFEIDNATIADSNELTSRVFFTSFGTEPTPVDVTFSIRDETGTEIYSEKDYIIVETEAVLTKKFEDLDLAPGKYTLVSNTLYNVDVADEFMQDFAIVKEEIKIAKSVWFWAIALIVLVLVALLVGGIRRKKSQQTKRA